jgi:demethylmenaquinone methyltransferase/2-methoxy-6-polyprenyl-1,4-benzoquinol methylase
MPAFDHFGALAPSYERFIKPKSPEDMLRIADLPINGALLDVGGGTGRTAQFMLNKASQVVVVDISIKMLLQATLKMGLETTCSGAEQLPFADASFERVIIVDAFHHVYDQDQTARELWRVLKPGGRIVIEEPDIRNWFVKLIAIAEKLTLMQSRFLAPPKIEALFAELGAKIWTERNGYISWIVVEKI